MIATKIKCDADGPHADRSYTQRDKTLSEAVAGCWWEIEIHPGSIAVRQPKTIDGFSDHAKHACCADCARRMIEDALPELIPQETTEIER